MHVVDQILSTGTDRVGLWAKERDSDQAGLPVRTIAVVLASLALRGARMRGDLPEPTPGLVRQVMHEDLPELVAGTAADVAACIRTLKLLVDLRRADGLLNAKRQAKLHTAIDDATPGFEWALADPGKLTWHRFYARMLLADGVDPADPDAVRAWLTDYELRPRASRRADLAAVWGVAGDGTAALTMHTRTIIVGQQTAKVELSVQNRYLQHDTFEIYSESETEPEPAESDDLSESYEHQLSRDEKIENTVANAADLLMDAGTALGLCSALRTGHATLAPVKESAGIRQLTDDIEAAVGLGDAGGNGGNGGTRRCLAPTAAVPAEEVAALVRAAPMLVAAADLAAWVEQREWFAAEGGSTAAPRWPGNPGNQDLGLSESAREELWRFAVATDLLRARRGRMVAGDGLDVWRDGTAEEVALLGVEAVGAVVAGLPRPRPYDGTDFEILLSLVDVLPIVLIRLFEAPVGGVSIARLAAEQELWGLPPGHDDDVRAQVNQAQVNSQSAEAVPGLLAAQLRPLPPPHSSSSVDLDYALPPDSELQHLLGLTTVNTEDHAELLAVGRWQAFLFDRLAAVGVLRRDGDQAEMTRLGRALVRTAFRLAGQDAPSADDLAAVDGATMLGWMASWPGRTRLTSLTSWLDARGGTAETWRELLAASGSASVHPEARSVFGLLGVWPGAGLVRRPGRGLPTLPSPLPRPDAEAALCSALDALVTDPVIGAHAAEALRVRGRQPDADPPWSARATLLFDRLMCVVVVALADETSTGQTSTGQTSTGQTFTGQPSVGAAVCAEFDRAAAGWPGGASALVRQLASVRSVAIGDVLRLLADNHSDATVARTARSKATGVVRTPAPYSSRQF